jgi:hypothetical protein
MCLIILIDLFVIRFCLFVVLSYIEMFMFIVLLSLMFVNNDVRRSDLVFEQFVLI